MSANKLGSVGTQGAQNLQQTSQTAQTAKTGATNSPLTFGQVMRGIGRVLLSVMTLGIYDLCKAIKSYSASETTPMPRLGQALEPKPLSSKEVEAHNKALGETISQAKTGQDYVELAFATMHRKLGIGGGMSTYDAKALETLRGEIRSNIYYGGEEPALPYASTTVLTHSQAFALCEARVEKFIIDQHNSTIGRDFTNPSATGPKSFTGLLTSMAQAQTPPLDLTGLALDGVLSKITESYARLTEPMTAEQAESIARGAIKSFVETKQPLMQAIANLPGLSTEEAKALTAFAKTTDIKTPEFFTELWKARQLGGPLMEALKSGDPASILKEVKTFSEQVDIHIKSFTEVLKQRSGDGRGDPNATAKFSSELMNSICRGMTTEQRQTLGRYFASTEFNELRSACSYGAFASGQKGDVKTYADSNMFVNFLGSMGYSVLETVGGTMPDEIEYPNREAVPQQLVTLLEQNGVKLY